MTSEPCVAVAAPVRRRVPWPLLGSFAVLLGVVWLARRHWSVVSDGAGRLAVADQGWLLCGAFATVGTWGCAALAKQGAVPPSLPRGKLVAAQFAASAANHLLPAGLGASAVNLRFLMRCGLSATRSATALGVKATASCVARVTLIAMLAPLAPGVLQVPEAPAGVVVAVVGVVALLPGLLLWARCRRALSAVVADIRAVHARPCRAAALWGGSFAFAVLHACVLIAVTRAIGLALSPVHVALLYLAASSAAALLPTPGGIGSLDAVLALSLAATGAPAVAAASAVLGYRLLTVWLPLVPGLVVLVALIRRRAL
ncbi:lysylphosphatidylglycerol synthase transmembrane domain-containing protein [Streptomyces acidiscabies]|uniref:lysylphosphatidylglycerol synthase transmembrane domain-containing protein n=1 Tax=Streptomyces acidiscabies TaxID=42234 RepID=UPI000951852D|nr:lysylphosphatidylglycerol synthase domain-containing protein [Streptomyces acidiscabies]